MTYAEQIIARHTYGGADNQGIGEIRDVVRRVASNALVVDPVGLAGKIDQDREQLVTELRNLFEYLGQARRDSADEARQEEGPRRIYANGLAHAYAVAEQNVAGMARKLGINLAEIEPLKPSFQENAPAEPAFKVRAPV